MIASLMSMALLAQSVPLSTMTYSWNKPGVSEAEFNADYAACFDVYLERLPRVARHRMQYRLSETMQTDGGYSLNRFSIERIDDDRALDAFDDCFRDRGYRATNITGQETRLIWGQYVSPEQRFATLYAIASEERALTRRR